MWDESPSRCDPSFRTHSSECLSWYCRDLKVYVWALQHDDQKVKDYGVTLAVDMIRRITTEGGIRGVHFCTLNLETSVRRVLENLEWIPSPSSVPQNKLIAVR
jgi:methylenetetrahydrofolate reductase (NADPH)